MLKTFFPSRQVLMPRVITKPNTVLLKTIPVKASFRSAIIHTETTKPRNTPKYSSNKFFPMKQFYNQQNNLLRNMNKNLDDLKRQVIKLKKDNNSGQKHIAKIEEDGLHKIVEKIDDSSNTRLTVLGLLLAILMFILEQQHEQQKEQVERKAQEEAARLKEEETYAKIEKIRKEYSGLLTTQWTIEESIKKLEKRLNELVEIRKSHWLFVPSWIESGIIKLQGDIEEKKINLQLTMNEIDKLDLYMLKQKQLEEEEILNDCHAGDHQEKPGCKF